MGDVVAINEAGNGREKGRRERLRQAEEGLARTIKRSSQLESVVLELSEDGRQQQS